MPTANQVSIDAFLPAVSEGQPVLSVLGLTPADFTPDNFEQLLDNAHDVGRGVTAISRLSSLPFFKLFSQVEAKQYSDGSVQYVFTGVTQDVPAITYLAKCLYKILGKSIYDSEQYTHFGDTSTLSALAGNDKLLAGKSLLETWSNDYIVCTFGYSAVNRHRLLFAVKQKPTPVLDVAVRTKGTIADLLHLNLHEVLGQPELRKEVELEDGKLKYVAYHFQLNEPVLSVFDLLQVNIFGSERAFYSDVAANLVFTCSQIPEEHTRLQLIEKLCRLYGPDYTGAAELQPHEVENLQRGDWHGRMWDMNEQHRPYQSATGEKFGYGVSISMFQSSGFKLTIFSYNNLVNLFTVQS